ncbi:hypothetical protein HERIO_975 [Hepatospora eriocheir]|uniref:Uncharacterized protein n=1 Tax=Hepatospora eriocheir TaxID=1081669 RepID=A0A1X0QBM1_9MICR|nr:hypothetical protein HERIO_975 [Hepatospora eriocheir]
MSVVEVLDSHEAYVYGNIGYELSKLEYEKVSIEVVQGVKVYKLKIKNIELKKEEDFNILKALDKNIKCKHSEPIKYLELNKCPHEGWEDLIDYWSCHQGEFEKLKNLKMIDRPNRIFVADFYIQTKKKYFPKCCNKSDKLFFNEFTHSIPDSLLIYTFFTEYFKQLDCIYILYKGKCFKIKSFYRCHLFKEGNFVEAIKVGVIEEEMNSKFIRGLNDYYTEKIFKMIRENITGIKLLYYKLSFITK